MEKKIRVGIIGTGFGARVHAPMMMHHPGFDVVAISSVARGRLEEIRTNTGIDNVYDDWRQMLDNEQLDLVTVTSAPFLHHEMVVEAYQHGADVLCEKPMAFDAAEAEAMIRARDKAGKLGMINFEFRYLPARQKVKELLANGKLGRLLHINYRCAMANYASLSTTKRGWLGQEVKAGGMLGAIGSHMFDSLMWWTDDRVASLSGQLLQHIPEIIDVNGEKETRTADDGFSVNGSLASGTTFNVNLVSAVRQSGWRLEVYGSEGTLVMTDDNKVELAMGEEPLKPVELSNGKTAPEGFVQPAARYYTPFYGMLDRVYEALANRSISPDLPMFENGFHVQRILDTVRASSKEGKTRQINSK